MEQQKNLNGAELSPEVLRATQDLAAQAALRAKEMLKKPSRSFDQTKVPEIPARHTDLQKAPEIPPKRMNVKKRDSDDNVPVPIPMRNQAPLKGPPVPQKPSSIQNSPLMAPKFKENTPSSPNINNRNLANEKSNVKNNNESQPQPRPSKPSKNNNRSISPSEDFGSEDALRGIESGLRNVERAMQQQMNLRTFEMATQGQGFSTLEMKSNIRALGGSISSLDNTQNLRQIENLRLNFEQQFKPKIGGIDRGMSLDQMREHLQNNFRANHDNQMKHGQMDNQPQQQQQQQQPPMQRPIENHYRSLDRHLPLEVQYSRQRSQEFEYIRQQLLPALQRNNENNANRQQATGLSREDLRLRRRSSHDETQYTQAASASSGRIEWVKK